MTHSGPKDGPSTKDQGPRTKIAPMAGRECYHCKQWIEEGQPHNCWTTTEAALTAGLSEDLRDAWERLRETAVEFGEQRIYASLNSIMFSRKACYFFVRPKRKYLEVCFFLGRTLKAPRVRRVMPASKTKTAHMIEVRHRDEVEAPITEWLQEAYEFSEIDARRFAGIVARKQSPASALRVTAGKARRKRAPAKKKKATRKIAKKR
jgi:uncharacterized protein DUF5655